MANMSEAAQMQNDSSLLWNEMCYFGEKFIRFQDKIRNENLCCARILQKFVHHTNECIGGNDGKQQRQRKELTIYIVHISHYTPS